MTNEDVEKDDSIRIVEGMMNSLIGEKSTIDAKKDAENGADQTENDKDDSGLPNGMIQVILGVKSWLDDHAKDDETSEEGWTILQFFDYLGQPMNVLLRRFVIFV